MKHLKWLLPLFLLTNSALADDPIGVLAVRDDMNFFTEFDGAKILSAIDDLTTARQPMSAMQFRWPWESDPVGKEIDTNQGNAMNPAALATWNSTAMVFGASVGGVGIGTTFAIKKSSSGRTIFLTNFHVVDKFCPTPQDKFNDLLEADTPKYPCHALFVLHDVAIDTKANTAVADGPHPWKSQVLYLQYFDKEFDLAAFQIDLPPENNIAPLNLDLTYDIVKPIFPGDGLDRADGSVKPTPINNVNMYPLNAFSVFLVAYTVPEPATAPNKKDDDDKKPAAPQETMIKKHWFKGIPQGIQTYENDNKLGLVSALRHDIPIQPGSSGGPLLLSDGRILGLNSAMEVKQYYARKWYWPFQKELETNKAYFGMPTTYVNSFLKLLE